MDNFFYQLQQVFSSRRRYWGMLALALGVMFLLGTLLTQFSIAVLFGLVTALGLGVVLLTRPDTATVIVIFLIYTNMSVVAYKLHDLPQALAGAVILLILVPFAVYVVIRREKIRLDYIFLLMLLYFAALLLSFFPAIDKEIAFEEIVGYVVEGLLLYFLILNVIRKPEILRKVTWALILGGALLGGLTLYQDVTKTYSNNYLGLAQRNVAFGFDEDRANVDPNLTGKRPKIQLAQRAQGPIGDPNRYAQILIVLLPLAYFRFFDEKKWLLKLLAAGSAGLILSGILLTYSRGAFLAICIIMLLMTVMRYIRPYQLLFSAVGVIALILIASPGYLNRIGSIGGVQGLFSSEKAVETDAVIMGRTTEMLAALMVFLDHPIVGVGPGQYVKFYALDYQDNPAYALRKLDKGRRAHSLYIELAAETGILGIGTFLLIVIFTLYQLWQVRKKWLNVNREYANYAAAFLLSLVGYLSTAVFLSLAFQRFYWVLVALAGSTIQILSSQEPEERAEQKDFTGENVAALHPESVDLNQTHSNLFLK